MAEHRDEIRPLAILFREPDGHILESARKFSKSLEKRRKAKIKRSQIPPAKPEAWKTMDRSKRLAVLDSSENIRMVFDYRAIVIPAALLSRNPADFRRLVYSYSQRFKLTTDTFKGPNETQEPGFRLKHCRNDDLTPGNVKLCESAGRAGGLPCYLPQRRTSWIPLRSYL